MDPPDLVPYRLNFPNALGAQETLQGSVPQSEVEAALARLEAKTPSVSMAEPRNGAVCLKGNWWGDHHLLSLFLFWGGGSLC